MPLTLSEVGAAAGPDAPLTPDRRWDRYINPVVFKDLLTYARGPSAGGGRLVLYSLLFALPLLAFAWAVVFVPGPVRFASRPVFLVVCALLAFFHLAVAVPAATAFALERDRNTLESLVVSPLSPWRLVLGKLGMALAIGALGKAAVLPTLAVAYVIGGADLGFLPRYLLLLFAVDASLAAFALNVGARHRDVPSKIGWIKAQTSQTQMALQAMVGLTVLTSLIPIYTVIFLVPLALQHGLQVSQALDALAPLGALHPLAALILWGDADLFGVRCPVWLLGVVFHGLLALPLLADCAEAQRSEASEPGRQTRLLALPVLAFTFLLTAAVAIKAPAPAKQAVSLLLPTLLLLWAAGKTGFGQPHRDPITARSILGSLLPQRALESAPGRAPGYVLLMILLAAPLVVWGGGGGGPALSTLLALALVGLSLATLGARLTARVREREDRAFLAALESGAEEDPEQEEERETSRSAPRRVIIYVLLASTLLPILAGTGMSLADQGTFPALSGLRWLFPFVAAFGIALSPFSALIPVVCDPLAFGVAGPQTWIQNLGLAPGSLFVLHLLIYGLILVLSLATLRPPLDLEQVLAQRGADRVDDETGSVAPEPAPG